MFQKRHDRAICLNLMTDATIHPVSFALILFTLLHAEYQYITHECITCNNISGILDLHLYMVIFSDKIIAIYAVVRQWTKIRG